MTAENLESCGFEHEHFEYETEVMGNIEDHEGADLLSIDNMTIQNGIKKLAKMQLKTKQASELLEDDCNQDDWVDDSLGQIDEIALDADEAFEDFTAKKLKKTRENIVQINPELPIEDFIRQGSAQSQKGSMSREQLRTLGIHDNDDNGNDYIMRKIDEIISSKKKSTMSRSVFGHENQTQEVAGNQTSSGLVEKKIAEKAAPPLPNENQKPCSTEIDMTDNIFLSHKNPELIKKRMQELLEQKLSRQTIQEDPDEHELALNEIE